MNNEHFNTLELLHKQFKYPFPTLKNPNAELLQDITENQWIDGEYLWLYKDNPDLRKKYKKTKTAHIAVPMVPYSITGTIQTHMQINALDSLQ